MIKEEIELEKEEYTFEETKKFLDHLEILKISNKIKQDKKYENYFVHHFSPCILYLIDSNVQEISWQEITILLSCMPFRCMHNVYAQFSSSRKVQYGNDECLP